jgi:hemolysin activation/secretion protein
MVFPVGRFGRIFLAGALPVLSSILLAMGIPMSVRAADIGTEEFIRNQERQRQLQQQILPEPDVRLQRPEDGAAEFSLRDAEIPCFDIRSVRLAGELAGEFSAHLEAVLDDLEFTSGMCIGARGINLIMTGTQDRIIAGGYVTTRVVAPAQDVKEGNIELMLIPGRIRQIRFDGVAGREDWQGNAGRTQYFRNEFPMSGGDLLNLRDIETALENFRRLQSVEVNFEIAPTERPGESDVVVKWNQGFPLRVTLSVDDSGSKWTGKNQGTLTVVAENPLGLSDTFYAYYNHDLGHKKDIRDRATGEKWESGTKGYGFHYSVPFANWQLAYNFSHHEYRQAVAGYFTNYLYWGWSDSHDLTLKHTLYRDGSRKSTIGAGGWTRASRNYIDDAELTIQRRRTAGWHLEFDHTEHVGNATLGARMKYQRGTGFHRSLRAPEEDFGEGTSRMRLVTGDFSLAWPFRIGGQTFSFSSQAHVQNNRTPLIPQDRFSIGNRYTVRGFDGEMTLMAERGYYWRNEFGWYYAASHQVYLLWDAGQVRGPSTQWLAGTYLEGYGAGWRGQFQAGGLLYYDVFIARPAKHPDAFPAQHSVIAATLSYSF